MLFGWETVMTFVLVSVVYAVAIGEPSFGVMGPFAVGLALFAMVFAGKLASMFDRACITLAHCICALDFAGACLTLSVLWQPSPCSASVSVCTTESISGCPLKLFLTLLLHVQPCITASSAVRKRWPPTMCRVTIHRHSHQPCACLGTCSCVPLPLGQSVVVCHCG